LVEIDLCLFKKAGQPAGSGPHNVARRATYMDLISTCRVG